MKRILITGANGFVGKSLTNKLTEFGHQPVVFQGDILEPAGFDKVVDAQLDHCFHLAAKTFVPDSWSTPEEFSRVNVMGTQRVLDFCSKKKISLTFLSTFLYGVPKQLPVSEDAPLDPGNPYALTKHLAEILCKFYATHYGLRVTIIRPFNIFGAGQNEKFLIPTVIHQALAAPEIVVKDLDPKRDYLYIDDLVDALMLTMETTKPLRVLNIASGKSVSVKEVIDCIQQVAGTSKKVVSEKQSRPNEIPDAVADIERARLELGWSPKKSFREGIIETLRFYGSSRH